MISGWIFSLSSLRAEEEARDNVNDVSFSTGRRGNARVATGRTSFIHVCITAARKCGVGLNNGWDAEAAAVLWFSVSLLFLLPFLTVTCWI